MTSRHLTTAMDAAIVAGKVRPVIFVEGSFHASGSPDEEFLRLWSGLGDFSWDSKTWTGAGKDKPVGNFKGKAVLESFFRRLHIRLGHLNGQRGNRYEAQPASLDFAGQNTARRPGTKQQLDEALAQLDRLHGGRLKIKLAALYEREVADEFGQAIKDHNAARGHGMQGFGTVTVATDANGNQYDVPADILIHNPPEITVYPPQAGHPTEGSPCK
jgi:hypothetical protein